VARGIVLKPVHSGEILREEFMEPLALKADKLALALRVSARGVYEIIREERDISPEMALRLGRCLGTPPEFWLNLQTRFDLEIARDKAQRSAEQEVHPIAK
jgi:addiction module HigA family antidote